MKVLQINSVCGIGSTGRFTVDIYNKLREDGHECLIAYGRGSAPKDVDSLRIGSNFDVNIHGVYTRITDRHGFGSKRATEKLINTIKQYAPDIVQLHNVHGYYIHIGVLFEFLRTYKRPIFWTMQDCWGFTGHCAYFDYVNCSKWKRGCERCIEKASYPKSSFLDASKINYQFKKKMFLELETLEIISASNWLASQIRESFLADYKIHTIHNGISLSIFKPQLGNIRRKYNCDNKFIILGVANNWNRRKGLKYFLELASVLSEEYKIILVGLNKRQVSELPLNITGICHTTSMQELAEIYTSANIFANFTLEDTFPTTNLEALACGTPVLTFNTGGSPEAIDETCGYVIEKGDLHAAVEVIHKLKDLPDMREACVKRAQMFSSDDKFSEYISLYEQKIEC